MWLAFFLSFSLGSLAHRMGIPTFRVCLSPGKLWKLNSPEMCLLGGSECGQANKMDHHRPPPSSCLPPLLTPNCSCAQARVQPYLPHNVVVVCSEWTACERKRHRPSCVFFYNPNCKSGFPPRLRVVKNNPTSVGEVMEGSGCCRDPLASIVCYIRCLIVVPHTQYSLSPQGPCMGPVLTPRPEIDINILNWAVVQSCQGQYVATRPHKYQKRTAGIK